MQNKRLLLIYPPFYRLFENSFSLNNYPISLGYLAGSVKKHTDWEVLVYNADFNTSTHAGNYHIGFEFRSGQGQQNYIRNLRDFSQPVWQDVRKTILEYSPSVVGISTMTQNFISACNIAQIIKDINKNILVIAGGPHPSIVGKAALDSPNIDICVKGEGEVTVVELLKNIETNGPLNNIDGIIFRKNGELVENPPRKYVENLGDLCHPFETAPFVLKDFSLYPRQAFSNVFANRGCPFHCSFCGSRYIWSRHTRFRPIPHLVEEIQQLQKMGVQSVYFCDDTFGINREWISKACSAIKDHCKGLRWSCQIHAQIVDDDILNIMKRAGCYKIELGIESGNNNILKRMQKHTTIELALDAARRINKHGIELHAYFMAGFPGETEDSLIDTMHAIKQIKGQVQISIFQPYPGTEIFEDCKKYGLINGNFDISSISHQTIHYFCPDIPKEKFEKMVRDIEILVDKNNRKNRMRRIFSINSLWRVRSFGFKRSIRLLLSILIPKK